jgi:hypothetical protein
VRNPFIVGMPVSGSNFFGRQSLISDVLSHLHRGSAVNVYGLRRIGKSSLLHQIVHLCGADPEWERYQPISVDCQAFGEPEELACYIAHGLDIDLGRRNRLDAWFLIRDKLRDAAGKSLLLLDEAELVVKNADVATLAMLRALHQEHACGLILFTPYRQIGEILREAEEQGCGSPLSNIFSSLRLPAFQAHEAEELLISQFRRGGQFIEPEFASLLASYVGAYPQLVQEIGWVAFDYCSSKYLGTLDSTHFNSVTDLWRESVAPWWTDMFLKGLDALSADPSVKSSRDRTVEALIDYGILRHSESLGLQPSLFVTDLVKSNPSRTLEAAIAKVIDGAATAARGERLSIPGGARNHVFISYSHHDAQWLRRLQVHLKPLVRDGVLELWDDTRITVGTTWRQELEQVLGRASVAVLIVSADFLASDFIAENELPILLDRASRGGVQIMPIVAGHCLFSANQELSKYQSVNPPDRPLEKMKKQEAEEMLLKLAQAVARHTGGG